MRRLGQRGFSLLEVLLSVAIISFLAGLSMPIYAGFHTRNSMDLAAQSIAQALRRAEAYSQAVKGDSQWGVRVASGTATLYKGSSYALRDTAYDENITIPGNVAVSGLSEVVFTKLSGAPSTTGTVTLSTTNQTRNISINAKGMVDY